MGSSMVAVAGLLVLKVTLVVAGAAGLSLLLRRSSAASRHALWTGTLVALLLLPVIALVPGGLPTIPLPLPSDGALTAPVGAPAPADPLPDPAPHEEIATTSRTSVDGGAGIPSTVVTEAGPGAGTPTEGSGPLGPWLVWLWLAGALAGLAPLAMGLMRGRRMIRGALPLRTPEWLRAIGRAARQVGLARQVPARLAPEARSAMAGGVVRPVVLLPPDSARWTEERRDLVLLHELVHVKRRDPARQILGRVVAALYWFHPLVWWAVRNAAMAREEACDERVVEIGGRRPSTYAEHLLELDRPQPVAAGLTGFHHPDLEKRLMAILTPIPRTTRTRTAIVGAAAVLWLVSIPLLAPAQAAPPQAEQTVQLDTIDPPPPPTPPARSEAPAPSTRPSSPTPPAAVAPPAPVEPQCAAIGGADSPRRVIQGSVDGVSVCLSAAGEIEWSPDGAQILSMEPGARMVLTADGPDGLQRLEIEGTADGMAERWSVDGEEAPVTPAVDEWRDALLAWAAANSRTVNLRSREARLVGEMARIQGEGARAQAEVVRAQAEALRVRSREVAAANRVAQAPELRAEVARVREEMVRLQSQIARTVGEQARGQGEQARLQAELGRVSRELERTQDDARREELTRQIRSLEEQLASIPEPSEAEVAELRSELAERRAELEQEVRRIQRDVETRVQERSSEIRELRREEVARVEEVRAEVARTMAENEERIRSVREEITALQSDEELEQLEAELAEIEARLLRAVRAAGGA